jgi:prepilin-type processing-associated H-X9-DG protein
VQVPFLKFAQVKQPSLTYWVADNSDLSSDPGNYFYMGYNTWRHRNGLNVLFVDGHVAWLSQDDSVKHGYYNYFYYPGNNFERWWDTD